MFELENIEIRRYEVPDELGVIDVCFDTGYMGTTLDGRFRDSRLFALIFSLAYPKFSPNHCFVASKGGEVLGYCFATPDTASFNRWFARDHKKLILQRVLGHTLWRSPGDLRHLVGWEMRKRSFASLRMTDGSRGTEDASRGTEDASRGTEDASRGTEDASRSIADYPAHFHINVLPAYQRSGIGSKLLETAFASLQADGVGAVHLRTSTANQSAIRFYQKVGFELLHTAPSNMWGKDGVYAITMGLVINARHSKNFNK